MDIQGVVYLGRNYDFILADFSLQTGHKPNWGYLNSNPLTPVDSANASDAIQNAAYVFGQHKSVLEGTDNTAKAALQLAVWETLYDSGSSEFSFANGRFTASNSSSSAATIALGWITSGVGLHGELAHTIYNGYLFRPMLANGTIDTASQELLYTPVPEPTTMIAGAFAHTAGSYVRVDSG